jgi:hypothetical protein
VEFGGDYTERQLSDKINKYRPADHRVHADAMRIALGISRQSGEAYIPTDNDRYLDLSALADFLEDTTEATHDNEDTTEATHDNKAVLKGITHPFSSFLNEAYRRRAQNPVLLRIWETKLNNTVALLEMVGDNLAEFDRQHRSREGCQETSSSEEIVSASQTSGANSWGNANDPYSATWRVTRVFYRLASELSSYHHRKIQSPEYLCCDTGRRWGGYPNCLTQDLTAGLRGVRVSIKLLSGDLDYLVDPLERLRRIGDNSFQSGVTSRERLSFYVGEALKGLGPNKLQDSHRNLLRAAAFCIPEDQESALRFAKVLVDLFRQQDHPHETQQRALSLSLTIVRSFLIRSPSETFDPVLADFIRNLQQTDQERIGCEVIGEIIGRLYIPSASLITQNDDAEILGSDSWLNAFNVSVPDCELRITKRLRRELGQDHISALIPQLIDDKPFSLAALLETAGSKFVKCDRVELGAQPTEVLIPLIAQSDIEAIKSMPFAHQINTHARWIFVPQSSFESVGPASDIVVRNESLQAEELGSANSISILSTAEALTVLLLYYLNNNINLLHRYGFRTSDETIDGNSVIVTCGDPRVNLSGEVTKGWLSLNLSGVMQAPTRFALGFK